MIATTYLRIWGVVFKKRSLNGYFLLGISHFQSVVNSIELLNWKIGIKLMEALETFEVFCSFGSNSSVNCSCNAIFALSTLVLAVARRFLDNRVLGGISPLAETKNHAFDCWYKTCTKA